jgi:uncharacterized membrane protein YjdF
VLFDMGVTIVGDTESTVLRYLPLPTGRSIPLIPDLLVSFSGILILCDATWYYSVLPVLLVLLLYYHVMYGL